MDGAIQYILDAKQKHPNRIDIVENSMAGRNHQNVFAERENPNRVEFQPAISSSNPFGHSPTPPAPTLGQPAFGAPSQPGGGAFGQPSALGSKPNPFAASAQPAFGQPAFGAPSQPGAGGVFGQPSAFGRKPSPFTNQSSGTLSPFSNASTTFTQPPQPTPNPFAQPPSQPPNPFTQQAQQNPFGAPSPAPNASFAAQSTQPNPSGSAATSQTSNPFASAAPASVNPFGGNVASNSNSFGATPQENAFQIPAHAAAPAYQQDATGDTTGHPPLTSYTTARPDGKLATFKGRTVVYQGDQPGFNGADGTWQRIWFPDGPPKINKDSEMEDAAYDDQLKAAYDKVRQTGSFENGVLPMIPPKQEWCLWDF
ncbi:Nuclear pore AMO1 [Hyphodiscus hymeniophilus]|uniref:Nuclear pore AMO1 n=1 Tax=Hyphodiscus hymeniophilus TaxID=353542 RepID=A0A9P7AUV9_9HELO|nr:Nuclear pore AMO1 [Hyphodiscus hymeniophilus]